MMNSWIQSFINLLFPRCCVVCGEVLSNQEEILCITCLSGLPRTNYHHIEGNKIEQRFWGKFPIQKATSYLFYEKESDYHRILYALKYNGRRQVGWLMGRYMANDMQSSDFLDGIDLIVPVPLHPKKRKLRGYNQSEWIGKGISEVTGIPMDLKSVIRKVANPTQTRKTSAERWENVEGIFAVTSGTELSGKHLLLVDDVLTTGATISSCATTILQVPDVKITILTLATA